MTALGVLAAALFGVFVLAVLKRYSPNIAVIAEAALVLFILFCVFKNFKEVFSEAEAILGETEISAGGIKIMLKIFGLLSAGALVSDICRKCARQCLRPFCKSACGNCGNARVYFGNKGCARISSKLLINLLIGGWLFGGDV